MPEVPGGHCLGCPPSRLPLACPAFFCSLYTVTMSSHSGPQAPHVQTLKQPKEWGTGLGTQNLLL